MFNVLYLKGSEEKKATSYVQPGIVVFIVRVVALGDPYYGPLTCTARGAGVE